MINRFMMRPPSNVNLSIKSALEEMSRLKHLLYLPSAGRHALAVISVRCSRNPAFAGHICLAFSAAADIFTLLIAFRDASQELPAGRVLFSALNTDRARRAVFRAYAAVGTVFIQLCVRALGRRQNKVGYDACKPPRCAQARDDSPMKRKCSQTAGVSHMPLRPV